MIERSIARPGRIKILCVAAVLGLVLSSFGDAPVFLREFHQRGLDSTVLAERRFVNEKLAIFRLTPAQEARLT